MTLMSCEEWIAARTKNPDRLGKQLWEEAYKQFREESLRGVLPKIPFESEKEILRDFLEKNICDPKLADNNLVRDGTFGLLRNTDKDFEKKEITPEAMQSLTAQLSRLKMNNAEILSNSNRGR